MWNSHEHQRGRPMTLNLFYSSNKVICVNTAAINGGNGYWINQTDNYDIRE